MAFDDLLASVDSTSRLVLGRAVTYTPTVGDAVEVQGVFDAAFVRVDTGTPGVASTGPAVWLGLSDLPSNPVTDSTATVTVGGTTYVAHEARPDGLGSVLLILHEV